MFQLQEESKDQLKDWIEIVLTKYYRKQNSRRELTSLRNCLVLNKPTTPALLRIQENTPVNEETISEPTVEQDKEAEDPVVKIDNIFLEDVKKDSSEAEEGVHATVYYQVGNNPTEHIEHYIITASKRAETPHDEQSLDEVLGRDQREIDFYTQIAPLIQEKLSQNGIEEESGLIKCIYGEYIVEQVPCTVEVMEPAAADIEEAFGIKMKPKSITTYKPETHSIMITQDFHRLNFKKQKDLLSFIETKAALRKIAMIHSTTYGIKLENNKDLSELWTFLLDPEQTIRIAVVLIESGLEVFIEYLSKWIKDDPETQLMLTSLKKLKPKLNEVFQALMSPGTFPSTLLHMDFNNENLYFRNKSNSAKATTESDSKSDPAQAEATNNISADEVECLISNWKIVSYGSLTQDIAFLMLSSVHPDIREDRTDEFIVEYYQTFMSIARKLKIPITFGLKDLMNEYEKSFFLVFLLVIGNFHEGHEFGGEVSEMYIKALRSVYKSKLVTELLKSME